MTVILFTTRAPSALATELYRAGLSVYEALAISEVLALAVEHPKAQIVITAEVGLERAKAIQQHYPTVALRSNATSVDVLWELVLLSSSSDERFM